MPRKPLKISHGMSFVMRGSAVRVRPVAQERKENVNV